MDEHRPSTVMALLAMFDQANTDQEPGTRYMRRLAFDQFVAVCGDVSLEDFSLAHCDAYRAALLGGWRPGTAEDLLRINRCLPSRARQGLLKGFAPVTAASYLKMIRRPCRQAASTADIEPPACFLFPRRKLCTTGAPGAETSGTDGQAIRIRQIME